MMSVGFCAGFSLKQQVLHQLIFSHEDTPDDAHGAHLELQNMLSDFKSIWVSSGLAWVPSDSQPISFNQAMRIHSEKEPLVLQAQKVFMNVMGKESFKQLCDQPQRVPLAMRGSVLNFLKESYYHQSYLSFWKKVADTARLPFPDGVEEMPPVMLKAKFKKWMEDHSGQIQQITELSLRGKELKCLPDEIGLLTNLEVLNLELNDLSFLPESIGLLGSLRELCLGNNQLRSLPSSLSQLQNLRKLDLSQSSFDSFPDVLLELPKVQLLYLIRTKITPSKDLISHFPNLRMLYLDLEQITVFRKVHEDLGLTRIIDHSQKGFFIFLKER